MTTRELLDMLVQDVLDLDLADAYVQSDWRPRLLRRANLVLSEVWAFADWDFKHKTDPAYVITNGTAALPADFLSTGPYGGLYVSGQQRPVQWTDPGRLLRTRQLNPTHTDYPLVWSIFGGNVETYPLHTGTFVFYYRKRRPTLIDKSVAGHNLDVIPADYHETVMFHGVASKIHPDLDERKQHRADYIDNRNKMFADLMHGREAVVQMGDEGYQDFSAW